MSGPAHGEALHSGGRRCAIGGGEVVLQQGHVRAFRVASLGGRGPFAAPRVGLFGAFGRSYAAKSLCGQVEHEVEVTPSKVPTVEIKARLRAWSRLCGYVRHFRLLLAAVGAIRTALWQAGARTGGPASLSVAWVKDLRCCCQIPGGGRSTARHRPSPRPLCKSQELPIKLQSLPWDGPRKSKLTAPQGRPSGCVLSGGLAALRAGRLHAGPLRGWQR